MQRGLRPLLSIVVALCFGLQATAWALPARCAHHHAAAAWAVAANIEAADGHHHAIASSTSAMHDGHHHGAAMGTPQAAPQALADSVCQCVGIGCAGAGVTVPAAAPAAFIPRLTARYIPARLPLRAHDGHDLDLIRPPIQA